MSSFNVGHPSPRDAARLHGAASGPVSPPAINHPHRREVEGTGAERYRPQPSATHTFADCPALDLICIPGGSGGVAKALGDRDTIEFVHRQASGARYITSVCTGALVLGFAGLLKGRRAATHWAYASLLPLVGAVHEKSRVVKDGNVISAGGVTAGIDFGLAVVAEIAGEATARRIQLGMEYDPAPPLDSGHPDRAPDIAFALLSSRYDKFRLEYRARIEKPVWP